MNKHTLAKFFRRYPRLTRLLVRVYRHTQARYTAGVNGLLLDEAGRVFLVEHVYHPIHPWGLPGGWVEKMEEPAQTLQREFSEETQLKVNIIRPILAQKGQFWGGHLDLSYLVVLDSDSVQVQLSPELLNWAWFAPDELPELNRFDQRVLEAARQQGLLKP